MFQVVEFDKSSGGGIGIVRDVWLTPRKKETFWPPYKISNQFHKALTEGQIPDSTWPTYKVARVFYITDDLLKAREKEKLAVEDSDVQTDGGTGGKKRKRVPKKLFLFDDEDDDEIVTNKKKNVSNTNKSTSVRKRLICDSSSEDDNFISDLDILSKDESPSLKAQSLIDALPLVEIGNVTYNTSQDINVSRSCLSTSRSADSPHTKQPTAPRSTTDPPSKSHGCGSLCSKNINVPRCSLSTPRSADSPRIEQSAATHSSDLPLASQGHGCQCSKSLEVIAKHLASIEKRVGDLYSNQQLLMAHFLPSSGPYPTPGTSVNAVNVGGGSLIPSQIILPCKTHEDVEKLEAWLEKEDSQKALEKTLYLRGGKKIKDSVPRMLETLFSNELASHYNWTGKNNKRPLKDLKINKTILSAVRRNHLTATATDLDITSTVRNWFRYTKDRDGGRERRRKEHRGPTAPALENQSE